MMFKSKYVILDMGFKLPMIFSEAAKHSDVARAMNSRNVISAGFVFINEEGKYQCYGESTSLKIKSDPERDSYILNTFLGVN